MAAFFKKKQQLSVGIDIGSAFIKAVAINKSKTVPELTAFAHEIGSIKKAMAKLELSDISVNTSISGPSTIVRIVEMPKMTEKELKNAVRFEAEKYIPYKLDEVVTDCVKIEDLASGRINVLLIAAKKSQVNNRIKLLSDAGLSTGVVDIDSFAVMNAFLNSQEKKDEDTTCALINIGAKTTNVSIVKGNRSYLVRDIQIAGNDITQAISEKMNLKKEEAEALKINPAERKNEIIPIVKGIFFTLLNEVRFSFDFYENHYGKNVQKVYVSGGTTRLEAINTFLTDVFSEDIIFWDPFNNVKLGAKIDKAALEPVKSSFAVAVGLGLREG